MNWRYVLWKNVSNYLTSIKFKGIITKTTKLKKRSNHLTLNGSKSIYKESFHKRQVTAFARPVKISDTHLYWPLNHVSLDYVYEGYVLKKYKQYIF